MCNLPIEMGSVGAVHLENWHNTFPTNSLLIICVIVSLKIVSQSLGVTFYCLCTTISHTFSIVSRVNHFKVIHFIKEVRRFTADLPGSPPDTV